MTEHMTIFACDDAVKAETARQFLIAGGYAEADITVETVKFFSYDGAKYDGGVADALASKIIVIGRKP